MKTLLKFIRERKEQQFKRRMRAWEKKRKRGPLRHLLLAAIFWTAWMIVWTSLWEYFEGRFHAENLWEKLIFNLIVGFFVGLVSWQVSESDYRKFNPANSDETSGLQSNNSWEKDEKDGSTGQGF